MMMWTLVVVSLCSVLALLFFSGPSWSSGVTDNVISRAARLAMAKTAKRGATLLDIKNVNR